MLSQELMSPGAPMTLLEDVQLDVQRRLRLTLNIYHILLRLLHLGAGGVGRQPL